MNPIRIKESNIRQTITINVPFANPTRSYRNPATVGPTNAPNANEDIHRPATKPKVDMSSGKPSAAAERSISINVGDITQPLPIPCKMRPMMHRASVLGIPEYGSGPTSMKLAEIDQKTTANQYYLCLDVFFT